MVGTDKEGESPLLPLQAKQESRVEFNLDSVFPATIDAYCIFFSV